MAKEKNRFLAGAAKVCITPPEEMMPAHSFLPIRLEGVYTDIYVRSLVLDDGHRTLALILIESADLARISDIHGKLREVCGLDPEDIFMAVTHTHEAPSFADDHPRVREDEEKFAWVRRYGDFVVERTAECVKEAMETRQPARWGMGSGESYINVCRDQQFEDGTWGLGYDFAAPSDKELAVIKFVDDDGRIIAGVLNYAVHGTACFGGKDEKGEKFLISGDLPGMVSGYLEERYQADGSVFLWTSGAAGNQVPVFGTAYDRYHHDKTHEPSISPGYACWGLCEHMAGRQGVDAVRILENTPVSQRLQIGTADRTLLLPREEKEGGDSAGPVKLALKLVMLNDTAILGVGGELIAEIGLRLKARSPLKRLLIVNHIAGRIEYLPDRRGYENRTFEGVNTMVKGGCAEDYITPAMLQMLEERF